MGDYSRALDAYQKALTIFTEKQSKQHMAMAEHSIGTVYSALSDYEQARDHFQRSLLFFEQGNRPLGRAPRLSTLSARAISGRATMPARWTIFARG